jgi:hypothetical protein
MQAGGSHTNFNDGPLIGGGMTAGFAIGGALLQGLANYRACLATARRRERIEQWKRREVFHRNNAELLGLRLNIEVDKTRTQALVIEAQRREIERLRKRLR